MAVPSGFCHTFYAKRKKPEFSSNLGFKLLEFRLQTHPK